MEKTDALGRRVWDKASYAAQAARRAREVRKDEPKDSAAKGSSVDEKKQIRKEKRERLMAKAPKERVWLEERQIELNLDKEVGKVIATDDVNVGFHCTMCECTLKDSQSYLDHLNGKRHNRLLGMSMRVEKKGVESVRDKLKSLRGEV